MSWGRAGALPMVCVALALAAGAARAAANDDPWAPLRFLLGSWEAVPAADGTTGSSTFTLELGGAVLVRDNHACYPAREGRPAAVHDDRLILYREGRPGGLRALYVDSEGHVIHYAVAPGADGRVVLVSDSAAGAPRYRLTYAALPEGQLSGSFEIAPPERPDAFAKYLEWMCVRPGAAAGSAKP